MLIVRDVFRARPGMASKLAKMMHENLGSEGFKVMTDLVGEFNSVVMETEVKNLDEFQKRWEKYISDPEFRKKMSGYTEMYLEGRREIYQLTR
jgi:hypothetical protein